MSARPIYLDKPAVAEFVALSETTIEKLVRENGFPKPRVLSGRRVAWLRNYALFDAPHAAIVSMDRRLGGVYSALDVGVWLGTLMVALTAEGVGCCAQASLAAFPWVLRALLPIAPEDAVLFGVAIGWEDAAAAANQCRTERSPLADNVQFVGF